MKNFTCSSYVTGKVRKTKHIVFYYWKTGCFRFAFTVRRLKSGVKITARNWPGGDGKTVSVDLYKKLIENFKLQASEKN